MRGNLPHAVESTWYITDAILTDSTSAQDGNISALALRSCYCTAFCRFVTGILDSMQENFYKVSMYDKARELDLPASFVELRHEAIHGELPSLVVLRQAAQKALDWLWKSYWKCLDDGGNMAGSDQLPPCERRSTFRHDLEDLVRSFSETALVPGQKKSIPEIDARVQATCDAILELFQDYNGGKQTSLELIDVLMEQWMLNASNMECATPALTWKEKGLIGSGFSTTYT